MNIVNDATGTTHARLGKQETIWAAVNVLRARNGHAVPRALSTAAARHLQLPAAAAAAGLPPAQPQDYQGGKPSARELREIFRLKTTAAYETTG